MLEDCIYSKKDVCEMLGISTFTIDAWYRWERMGLRDGEVSDSYLPKPVKMENEKGRPLRWSLSMVDTLRQYQACIVKGRNGIYGKYTNACWH